MAEQLLLNLPRREAFGREAFFVTPSNTAAMSKIDAWQDWPGNMLALCGPAQSGKTHLAHVWAQLSGAVIWGDLKISTLPDGPFCIENVHKMTKDKQKEEALFHCFNAARNASLPVLLTGVGLPHQWGIELPDLASRVRGLAVAELERPDDSLLSAVMIKQFDDRQIKVGPKVIEYLLARMERSFAAVSDLVDALDTASFRSGKPVSLKLARETLDRLTNEVQ